MVTRYQEVSLHGELDAAVTLLSAAGTETGLEVSSGELPDAIDEAERAALRSEVARLPGATPRTPVTIEVVRKDGRIRLALHLGGPMPATAV
jgi:hypothetical protein